MEKLPMCRICLAENFRMCMVNKNLRDLYERLTNIPFVTDDSRPILTCSFCCAKLKQSFRLLRKCLDAEEQFTQIINGSYEPKPLTKKDHLEVAHGFFKTPIENISIVEVGQRESVVVKEELQAVCEELDDILVPKEEYQCDDLELKNEDNSHLDEEDILAHRSEDDLHLMEFKIEEEEQQEAPKENVDTKSPAVAKERKPHLRRTKLEDSIPADQKTNQISDSKIIGATQNRTSEYITKFKKPHECEICHHKFSKKSDFTKHVRTHTGEKPYKCDICLRSFSQKAHLTDHTRTHTGEKPYKCDSCQCSYSRKVYLTDHIRTHTGKKPHKCDICECCFSKKCYLASHIRTHTGEKPYKCDTCHRSFSQKVHLTDHFRTHTGEKPYKCDICRRSFSRKFLLTNHIHTHTGENPNKCAICQRSFSDKYSLINHIRTHTGEKPYNCDICQRSFTQKVSLTRHMRTHTSK